MADTTNLALPYLEAAQSQKHVTHNEALTALDAIVMLSVLDRDLTAPPGGESDGDRYLVGGSATGTWSGEDGNIAAYQDGAYNFYPPQEGWVMWVADEDLLVTYDGSSWVSSSAQNVALLGVNTTADATNKLAVASAAILHTNVGNGVQHKLNKAATGDTASVLWQTNWSGRAEVGTCGNDDFEFKGSPDGSTWSTGLTLVVAAKSVPKVPSFTVANLPAASTAGAGARAFVTDANATTFASVVAGSGANGVPVYSDGTNWRIG
jgi:hypothetical protein